MIRSFLNEALKKKSAALPARAAAAHRYPLTPREATDHPPAPGRSLLSLPFPTSSSPLSVATAADSAEPLQPPRAPGAAASLLPGQAGRDRGPPALCPALQPLSTATGSEPRAAGPPPGPPRPLPQPQGSGAAAEPAALPPPHLPLRPSPPLSRPSPLPAPARCACAVPFVSRAGGRRGAGRAARSAAPPPPPPLAGREGGR